MAKKYKYDGLELTAAQWCQKQQIKLSVFYRRIAAKWPLGEVLEFEPRPPKTSGGKSFRTIEFEGQKKTVKQWAAECGISVRTIYQRRRRGLPLAQVLSKNQPPRKSKPNQLRNFSAVMLVTKQEVITRIVTDNEQIGREVRAIRTKAGLTLKQAADDIGLSPAYLSALETGSARWTQKLVNEFNDVAKYWVAHD